MRLWSQLLIVSSLVLLVPVVMYAQAGVALTGIVTDISARFARIGVDFNF